MARERYSEDHLLFYPGAGLSPAEKQRMDRYEVPIEELTVDHLVYSMGRQIEANFQTFYTVAEEVVGEEAALRIAREIGRRYGGRGYATLLKAYGRERRGDPRMMALYQDLVHAIRGPKHAAALFAEHDDTKCVVRRRQCIYYSEEHPENGKYTEAFEAGCFEGYVAADDNLERVDVIRCRFQGASGCEQHWVFKPADQRLPAEPEPAAANQDPPQ
ncbi:MAG TPA: hypothetical protein VIL37_13955 [Natronosporangium sp.]